MSAKTESGNLLSMERQREHTSWTKTTEEAANRNAPLFYAAQGRE